MGVGGCVCVGGGGGEGVKVVKSRVFVSLFFAKIAISTFFGWNPSIIW